MGNAYDMIIFIFVYNVYDMWDLFFSHTILSSSPSCARSSSIYAVCSSCRPAHPNLHMLISPLTLIYAALLFAQRSFSVSTLPFLSRFHNVELDLREDFRGSDNGVSPNMSML
jgi:hypothetical protein